MHAIAYIVFILLFATWLGKQLNKQFSLKQHWLWIAGAVVTTLIGVQFFGTNKDLVGNFVQHMSGGASSALLFIYLIKTLKLKFSWQLTTVLLFAFVSTLGVMNELAEYAGEFLGPTIFSVDSHDTWRDLVANTAGASIAWLLYSVSKLLIRQRG